MKKVTYLSAAALLLFATACKKSYVCSCTQNVKAVNVSDGEVLSDVTSELDFKYESKNQKDADETCQGNENDLKSNVGEDFTSGGIEYTSTTNCEATKE